jgi:UDP-N-acetylglucosamine:LPS N-acetylglucosamine transferase
MTTGKVMAIASGGGHWVQLLRLRPAFEGFDVFYVSLDASSAADVPGHRYYTIRDASRKNRLAFIVVAFQLLRILLKERPRVVITTGSAPALVALILARRLFGTRTIWIDSIANVERLSTSGAKAGRVADIWLTQWPDLAGEKGGPEELGRGDQTRRPEFWGAVL